MVELSVAVEYKCPSPLLQNSARVVTAVAVFSVDLPAASGDWLLSAYMRPRQEIGVSYSSSKIATPAATQYLFKL